jgi:hypothetical protein
VSIRPAISIHFSSQSTREDKEDKAVGCQFGFGNWNTDAHNSFLISGILGRL